MTLKDFDNMNEKDQLKTILVYGVSIGERMEGKFFIVLYQIDSFYVESFFSNASMRKVGDRSFDNTEQLLPYINQINLEDLV